MKEVQTVKTPVNKETLKQHFTYNWWKYLLLAVISFFAIDLLYTATAYRSPEDKKVQVYVYGYINQNTLDEYMARINREQMPDMEVMDSLALTTDATYGPMQLMTYMAVGEGDLYLLPRDQFISSAAESAFYFLEEDQELMQLFSDAGVNLQNGWRKITETGETHLCGIPLSKLPGLSQYVYVQDGYLCVLATGGNVENTMKFLRILAADMIKAPEESAPQETAVPSEESTPQ